MFSPEIAEAVKFATRRASRPKLWLTLGLILLSILALGRYQRAVAENPDSGWKTAWTELADRIRQ